MELAKLKPAQVLTRYKTLKADRSNWESHWDELSKYIMPNKDQFQKSTTPGEKKNTELFDNTAIQANELLAAALHSLLTNPHGQWFSLSTGDDEVDNVDVVRMWLQKAAKKMNSELNKSNFQTEIHEVYLDLGCPGTAPLYMEEMEDENQFIRFQAISVAYVVIAENAYGVVDECYVEYKLTANQIIELFGEENVPDVVKTAAKVDDVKKFTVIHGIYPKKRYGLADKSPFKFTSQHVLQDGEVELRVKGYRDFPFVVPRWSKVSNEIYGRSPGMTALPEAKTINEVVKTTLKGAQKVVDPPIQMPDDGFVLPISLKPAGINYYRAGSPNDIIRPIFNDSRIDFGFQFIEEKRKRIKESFYADQLILSQGPQQTATEVLQRTEESMRLLGPILGRMQSELLKPMIDRVFAMMFRRGMFDPPPAELEGRELEVRYSSQIARAQRTTEAQNILRAMEALAPFINLDPAVAQNFNGDALARIVWGVYGAPQQGLRTQDEVMQIRQSMAQAQQQAVAQEQSREDVGQMIEAAGVMG